MKIKEAYCSYEVSKLLKEKGFEEDTNTWYNLEDGNPEFIEGYVKISNVDFVANDENCCSAPTHQMACAWLREKYGYHISILWNCGDRTGKETFIWGINNINNFEDKGYNGIGSNVYEETVEKALKYALENLI